MQNAYAALMHSTMHQPHIYTQLESKRKKEKEEGKKKKEKEKEKMWIKIDFKKSRFVPELED